MPCDECGCDYLATRTEARTSDVFICDGCDGYSTTSAKPCTPRSPM